MASDELWGELHIVNSMNAYLQGWYTYENILHQLKHPESSQDKLALFPPKFQMFRSWGENLQQEKSALESAEATTNATELLTELAAVTADVGGRLGERIERQNLAENTELTNWAIGCVGFSAYSYENMIRGLLQYAQLWKNDELADRTLQSLQPAKNGVLKANWLFGHVMKNIPRPNDYYPTLTESAQGATSALKAASMNLFQMCQGLLLPK